MKPSDENPELRTNIRDSILQDFRIIEGHALLELLNNPDSESAKFVFKMIAEKLEGAL
jgi:hypothetical protein